MPYRRRTPPFRHRGTIVICRGDTESALSHFRPPACLRAKGQLARRGANHGHVVGLVDGLHLFMRRPAHREETSRKRGKSQGLLGGNYNHHMAATLQLFDGFIRPQRVAEPMAATLLKPMDSPVGLNHKQARQDVMPFDMLFDAQLHLRPSP